MKRFVWILAILALTTAGCGGIEWFPETDPDAPASVTVTQTPDSSTSVIITATVEKADGTAVADGTEVTFSGGGLSTVTETTIDGIASVILTSDVAGSFTVTASAGFASGHVLVVFKDIVTVTAEPNPTFVGDTVTITADVTNPDGTIVDDGTTVTFTTTGGTFLSPASVTTIDGVATVTFSSTLAGTFTISATVGAATGNVSVTIT